MRRLTYLSLLLALLFSCGASVRLNHASEPILKRHLRVAVVDVKVDIREEGLFKEATDLARSHLNSKTKQGDPSASQPELEEYVINSINRSFLNRGFLPIQRSQIKSVIQEQRFQQSGLTDDATKIGQLVKADAVFQATVVARKKSGIDVPVFVACLMPPLFLVRGGSTQLIFSGSMTSVETGTIILSGTSSNSSSSYALQDFDQLINDWFDEVPEMQ